MEKQYDLIIIGAGPAGIFTALEYKKISPEKSILLLEKGRSIEKRVCPKRKTGICVHCKPCNITTGFAGAGAYSDGKLSLCPDVGGYLPDYLGRKKTQELIDYVDKTYLSYGADSTVYGLDQGEKIAEIRNKAIRSNLKLIECPIRHLGTEMGYSIYGKIQKHLEELGIDLSFNNPVNDLIIGEDGGVKGVIADKKYYGKDTVVAVGREGADWLDKVCERYKIDREVGIVDVGVRVECRDDVMKKLNESMYESKLIYYTKTFDDKVRVFCSNPSGEVATEIYDEKLAVVNGHSYKGDKYKTNNTNFALLVSLKFTEPFSEPIEYGKHIARLGNMLAGDKILVQRFGDFKRGRRTNIERLNRNNTEPTLKDAIPGDLSLVLPYRIMLDIKEMIEALDNIAKGLASNETLLYGVEVKFYSNQVKVNKKFNSNLKNLYAIGDGAGITRGLMQASCNGVAVARSILGEKV